MSERLDNLNKGKPELVQAAAALTTKQHGWCEVQYGYDADRNYLVHFTSHHDQRPFPQNLDTIYKLIIGYIDQVVPKELEKDFFPSPETWEKKLITVKIIKAGEAWNFDDAEMENQIAKVADLISKEIEKHTVRKRFM